MNEAMDKIQKQDNGWEKRCKSSAMKTLATWKWFLCTAHYAAYQCSPPISFLVTQMAFRLLNLTTLVSISILWSLIKFYSPYFLAIIIVTSASNDSALPILIASITIYLKVTKDKIWILKRYHTIFRKLSGRRWKERSMMANDALKRTPKVIMTMRDVERVNWY